MTSASDEIFFLYKEYCEYSRLYFWFKGSEFSFFTNKANPVEAERYRYLSNYYWDKLVTRARQLGAAK